jgi:tetratricopeptide (TPR) repeat protein
MRQSVKRTMVQGDLNQTVILGDRPPYRLETLGTEPEDLPRDWSLAMPSQLLRARYGVIDFVGRDQELARLKSWRDTEADGMSVLLLHGRGGEGKTRLAAHFARESAAAGRQVQQARHRMAEAIGPRVGGRARGSKSRRLVLVDYSERWPNGHLHHLFLDPALQRKGHTRVLLIARPAGYWWQPIHAWLDGNHVPSSDLEVPPLGKQLTRTALFDTAYDVFLAELTREARSFSRRPMSSEPVRPVSRPPGLETDPRFEQVLAIHMAALAAADSLLHGGQPPTDPARISAYLLDRERLHWQKLHTRESDAIRTAPETMRQLVFLASLTGPLLHKEALQVLSRAEMISHPSEAHELLREHALCYPNLGETDLLQPLYPDRLAEDMVALTTPGHNIADHPADPWASEVYTGLLPIAAGEDLPAWSSRAMAVLVPAAKRWPHLAHVLRQFQQNTSLADIQHRVGLFGTVHKENVPVAIVLPRVDPASEVHESVASLPPLPNTFTGRRAELERLDRALQEPGSHQVLIVHGLGGIGKSSLAAHWAGLRRDRYQVIWWITADTPAGIEAGLAALASALQPGIVEAGIEVAANWALAWLQSHTSWLIVLDNVTDPAHITPLLSRGHTGHFIVTTRLSTHWAPFGSKLRLNVLTQEESVELLSRYLPDENIDIIAAQRLCSELGFLPVAIEQAAAYIHQTRIGLDSYLALLRNRPDVIYDWAAKGTDAQRTIARMWRITLDNIAPSYPLAVQFLQTMAWWAPHGIPRTILRSTEPGETAEALGVLAAYSMITLGAETVTIHTLVQSVARTPDLHDPHRAESSIAAARDRAAELLGKALPIDHVDPANWKRIRELLPHVMAFAEHADPSTDSKTTAGVLTATGLFLAGQGDALLAASLLERALVQRERELVPDSPETLRTRTGLALAFRVAGDPSRAAALFEHTLTTQERVLGSDHPDTLTTRSNLALTYTSAGDTTRAVPLLEATLADQERVLGSDHPDTLTTRSNLALTYTSAGDTTRAVPLLEATLADQERVLGIDHPQTLVTSHALASARRLAGDLRHAIALYEQTLTYQERVLGSDHPDTLSSRSSLGAALLSLGERARAIALLEQSFVDRMRVLGPEHPDTLGSGNDLAHALAATGDTDQVVALLERLLDSYSRTMPEGHPTLLDVQARLNKARAEERGRPPQVAHLILGDSVCLGGVIEQGTVVLDRASPDDTTVTLAVTPNLADAPVQIVVPAGEQQVSFDYTPRNVSIRSDAQMTVSFGDSSVSAPLAVLPGLAEVIATPAPGTVLAPHDAVTVIPRLSGVADTEMNVTVAGPAFAGDSSARIAPGEAETRILLTVRPGPTGQTVFLVLRISAAGRIFKDRVLTWRT